MLYNGFDAPTPGALGQAIGAIYPPKEKASVDTEVLPAEGAEANADANADGDGGGTSGGGSAKHSCGGRRSPKSPADQNGAQRPAGGVRRAVEFLRTEDGAPQSRADEAGPADGDRSA